MFHYIHISEIPSVIGPAGAVKDKNNGRGKLLIRTGVKSTKLMTTMTMTIMIMNILVFMQIDKAS